MLFTDKTEPRFCKLLHHVQIRSKSSINAIICVDNKEMLPNLIFRNNVNRECSIYKSKQSIPISFNNPEETIL